jgi:pimeloyl-ACP methyl ester carboxylesterase
MPFIDNRGIKIHYEVEGNGPPLVLMHGALQEGSIWTTSGYVPELKKHYRLIIPDLRGHGKSDRPKEFEDFNVRKLADDVIAVLDELNIPKTHFFGYSVGAFVGVFGIVRNYPSRLTSLISGGLSAYLTENITERFKHILSMHRLTIEKGIQLLPAELERSLDISMSRSSKDFILSLDPLANFSVVKVMRDSLAEGISDKVLSDIKIPCLCFAGDGDVHFEGAKLTAERIPGARFIILPGLNHSTAHSRSSRILPNVKKFLNAVSISSNS